MIKTTIDISEDLAKLVKLTLERELEKEFDLAKQRFEERKGEIIAGILLLVSKQIDMQVLGEKIVFEIKNNHTLK